MRLSGKKGIIIVFSACLAVVAGCALWLSGWSLLPFAKRYIPDYYFHQLHAYHRGYFPEGDRAVFLNGVLIDSITGRGIIGVANAEKIIEYSSMAATEKFGSIGQYGVTEIFGENPKWLTGRSPRKINPAMLFTHSGVPLPNKMNPRADVLIISGEMGDTLYLGSTRYRVVSEDTLNRVIITLANNTFSVNSYRKKGTSSRTVWVYRNGEPVEVLDNAVVDRSSGSGVYFYDDRVTAFSNWVDRTVSAIKKTDPKTGDILDKRLIVANGEVLGKERSVSRIQATDGTIVYLNGVEAWKQYGWKSVRGAIEVTGDPLQAFRPEVQPVDE